jgi:hypothetical protein
MTRLAVLVVAVALAGCARSLGTVGVIRAESDTFDVKLLRPGASGRSCRASVLGIPLSAPGPTVREALDRILALDAEGDVVVNTEVRSEEWITGLYNRRCIEVRGDLARAIPTVVLPMPPEHHGH